jgi:transcriptional modulator of MazE/toxin, MazF
LKQKFHGVTPALGAVLRNELRTLPDVLKLSATERAPKVPEAVSRRLSNRATIAPSHIGLTASPDHTDRQPGCSPQPAQYVARCSKLRVATTGIHNQYASWTKGREYPTRVKCRFGGKEGQVVLDQLRTVDKARLVRQLGVMPRETGRAVPGVLTEMFADRR